jgi:chlorite dismutase
VLALEAPELHEVVDLTRHLRASGARRHVRVEIPFHTGRLIEESEIPDVLS